MTFLESIILGLVQGVAEFLPISSSGHLALLQNVFEIEAPPFYDVLLHFGTLVAVFIYYWSDIWDMIREFFLGCRAVFVPSYREKGPIPSGRRLVMLVIVATLPLVLILPVKDLIDTLGGNNFFIGFALIVTGAILYISDRMAKGRKTERTATVMDALLVGCAQALATVPGISRSGATIAAGMGRNFDRKFAVRFSFLMSLPAVLGANLLSLIDVIMEGGVEVSQIPVYLVGVAVAAVSGYFAIRLVDMLASKGKFGRFAYYCWAMGALTLILAIVL